MAAPDYPVMAKSAQQRQQQAVVVSLVPGVNTSSYVPGSLSCTATLLQR